MAGCCGPIPGSADISDVCLDVGQGLLLFTPSQIGQAHFERAGIVSGIFLLESLAAGYLDPLVGGGTKDFAPYVLMILVLMFKPYGLFGQEIIERV